MDEPQESGDQPEQSAAIPPEYRYDPVDEPDSFPPVACTMSEFALLSVGLNPRLLAVHAAHNPKTGPMDYIVIPAGKVGNSISLADALDLGRVGRRAANRYEQINLAVRVGELAKPLEEAGGMVHLWTWSYEVLLNFANKRGWPLPEYMRGGKAGAVRHPALSFLDLLNKRTGQDNLPRLKAVLYAYYQYYEADSRDEQGRLRALKSIVEEAWSLYKVDDDGPGNAEANIRYVLMSVRASHKGRRPAGERR